MEKTAAPEETLDKAITEEKVAELDILKQSVEEAKSQAQDYLDQLKRLASEFENYRKRTEKEFSLYRQRGKVEILIRIIKLLDVLERAENMAAQAKDIKTIIEGLGIVREEFSRFLKDEGVTPLEANGSAFDPNRHEALCEVESEAKEGTVVEEVLKGYVYGNVVIRPAQVKLAKKINKKSEDRSQKTE